ncbi:hypothetical protein CU097_002402 [Rhizopus azygosporus]|uniref:Uncharacterized protein n=1 Tax=Rhizopus azygosporus TaxID=86630 RepID=A0A367J2X2_RHIAZ|nr:hypothetical protein CU097_002402 [Rhizopus azygosporus]
MAVWYKQLSSALYQDALLMSSLLSGNLGALRNPDKQTYSALKALLGHAYDNGFANPGFCKLLISDFIVHDLQTANLRLRTANKYPRFRQLCLETIALLLQGRVLLPIVFLPLCISGSASTSDLDAATIDLTSLCRLSTFRVSNTDFISVLSLTNLETEMIRACRASCIVDVYLGDYRFLQQREIRVISCYIERSLANNVYIPLFQVNARPGLIYSVIPLMKLHLIFSSVVLTKPYCGPWPFLSYFLGYPAHLLKLNNLC